MLEPDLPSRRAFIPVLLAPSSDNGELRMEGLAWDQSVPEEV